MGAATTRAIDPGTAHWILQGTIRQAIRADRELFTIMAQELQDSVQPDARGNFPMEMKLKELRTDPRVTMFLLPMPKGSAKEPEKTSPATAASKASSGTPTRPTKRPKTSAKAKAMCPAELKEYAQRDSNGQAICWAFNQKSGCKLEVNNRRCKKGMHSCINVTRIIRVWSRADPTDYRRMWRSKTKQHS